MTPREQRPVRVVFVTMTRRTPDQAYRDPSVIYRCTNPALALQRAGISARVFHVDALPQRVDADIAIFHRPRATPGFARARKILRGAAHWADLDDLLFDLRHLDEHPALLSGMASRKQLQRDTECYAEAIGHLGRSTVSTPELAEHLKQVFGSFETHVVRNGWDPHWRALGVALQAAPRNQRVISYFAGTSSHRDDLSTCMQALERFAGGQKDVVVDIYGSIDPQKLGLDGRKFRAARSVPFHALSERIRNSWVAVAPLRQTPFNLCKSAIKFVETGLFGCPLVASPLPEYTRIAHSGILVAESSASWEQHLNALCDPAIHQEHGVLASNAAARQSAEAQSATLRAALTGVAA